MLKPKSSLMPLLTLLGVMSVPSAAFAGAFVGVTNPASPGSTDQVVAPERVPGKEYSNYLDRQGHPNQGTPDPGQVVDWDANPNVPAGTKDGVDFSNLWNPTLGNPIPSTFEVNAIANHQDAWGPVLLFSTGETGLSFNNVGGDTILDNYILYETKGGIRGTWATPSQIDQVTPDDVDGLEVWGTDGDSDRYSLAGDPLGCSIFDSVGNCVVTKTSIATAINNMGYFGFTIDPAKIDLDGLLFYETPVATMTNLEMGYLANIEFSLAPIDGNGDNTITFNTPGSDLDGGEIFVWNFADSTAQFLNQGGHIWNTTFDVKNTFGTGSENVDALERVGTPEPSATISLLALGLLGAGSAIRRKRQR